VDDDMTALPGATSPAVLVESDAGGRHGFPIGSGKGE